jgi:hypothetical protein
MREFINAMRQLLGWRTESRPLLLVAGMTVASIELVISLLILVPATATAGLIAALSLLTGFTALIAKTVAGGRQVKCHCFGSSGGALRPDHLWRNSALLLAIIAALSIGPSSITTPWTSAAFSAMVGLAGAICIARWDELRFVVTGKTEMEKIS